MPVTEADRRALAAAIPKLRVLPPIFHPVHLFDFKRYVPRVVALRALRGVPYLAGKWDSRPLRKSLRRELADTAVDVVYVDHLGMARYLPDIESERPSCRIVLDQHNVESDFFKQFADKQTGLKKLVAQDEYRASVQLREGGAEERACRRRDLERGREALRRARRHPRARRADGAAVRAQGAAAPGDAQPLLRRQPPLASERRGARLVLSRRLAEDPRARARCDVRDRRRRPEDRCVGQAAASPMRGRCPA